VINPYLASQLKHAKRVFARSNRPILAAETRSVLGALADAREPDESEAHRLVRLAFGDPINA
jgi:hypothetical protein